MVNPSMCTRSGQLKNELLQSNLFLKNLNANKYSDELNQQIESYLSNNNTTQIISKIDEQFKKISDDINSSFIKNNDEIKCCRDINYYIDLVYAIVKSTNILPKHIQDKITSHVEQKWKEVPQVKHIDECIGKIDLDSIRKRCILKHLHDLKMDKGPINSSPEMYKTYMSQKWEKLIKYTKPQYGGLYVKIENDSMGIIDLYDNFLHSTNYICDDDLDNLSSDDITISTDIESLINNISLEKISTNDNNRECYNKTYINMLKKKTSAIKRVNNLLSIGIALLGPLGSLLRRFVKKKIEIDENMSEGEMSELYDNSENRRQYISYNSVS
ncbi:PIR Superfamily Protein [Plasmodium ovale wallikeri]|uniref:PIR Superfamily Protein n=1 Tax=Plasmodium ovale wallikeri TaxID=864142 RepID=A0A1A9ANL6_PLAOA|nr:PIR Superfamily Protein [Plasmodium ovale wallikeri]